MAVVIMGGNEKEKTLFRDFLGMGYGDESSTLIVKSGGDVVAGDSAGVAEASDSAASVRDRGVSRSSDPGPSETQAVKSVQEFNFQSRRSVMPLPDVCHGISRQKRTNSDSNFVDLTRKRMLLATSNYSEWSPLKKMYGKSPMSMSDSQTRLNDDEMMYSVHNQLKTCSASHNLHPFIRGMPDAAVSKWERPLSMNAGQMIHRPTRFSQGTYVDTSLCVSKDLTGGRTPISQTAADEGSRTGIKGFGILKILDSTRMTPTSGKTIRGPQIADSDISNKLSHHGSRTAGQQMTIFYAGQAHVFDDVDPKKAEVIMALAGSNGASWSTIYPVKPKVQSPDMGNVNSRNNQLGISRSQNFQDLNKGISIQMNDHAQVSKILTPGDVGNAVSGMQRMQDATQAELNAEKKQRV